MPAASLNCQKCKTPITVDASLQHLNPASFKLLADAAPILDPKAPEAPRSAAAKERQQLYNEVSQHAGPPVHKGNVATVQRTPSGRLNPDMSFIMLSGSQMTTHENARPGQRRKSTTRKPDVANVDEVGTLSQEMETTMRLFEILSARSDIDHPVCSECTELLLESLQKRQVSVTRERDAYVEFLKRAQQDIPTDEERIKTKEDLERAQRREKEALRELEELEAEKARMEAEIAALDAEAEDLDEEEEKFWHERNAFTAELAAFQEERDSLQTQLANDSKVLEALQRTNVYNDTFCIGHDGTFGTINGLRLGRTPDQSVDWPEINAAWGQTLLLLTVVIEKLGFRLKGYELVPVGSTSKVVKVEYSQAAATNDGKPKKTIFELYSSGDLPLGLSFLHRNFDNAMVAFLDCLRQVGEHVERTTPRPGVTGLKMPYSIVKDKIGDVSIKLGNFGQEEQWTKACKYTLTCCKFLLAHASHITDTPDSRSAR
jgi:beclin 1